MATRKRGIQLEHLVPPNTTATIYVPAANGAQVTESGRPAEHAPGVKLLKREGDRAVYSVGSGRYSFAVK